MMMVVSLSIFPGFLVTYSTKDYIELMMMMMMTRMAMMMMMVMMIRIMEQWWLMFSEF